MEIRVSEDFLNMLETLGLPLKEAIKLIKWASDNPEAAKFLELCGKLNGVGRKKVKYHIFLNPLSELEEILREQEEACRTLSVYMRVLRAAKKGGYSFTTKSGVKGFLKVEYDNFCFTFDVQGVKVELIIISPTQDEVRSIVEDGDFDIECGELYLEGERIGFFDKRAELVREAIKQNVNPYVVLAIG